MFRASRSRFVASLEYEKNLKKRSETSVRFLVLKGYSLSPFVQTTYSLQEVIGDACLKAR